MRAPLGERPRNEDRASERKGEYSVKFWPDLLVLT